MKTLILAGLLAFGLAVPAMAQDTSECIGTMPPVSQVRSHGFGVTELDAKLVANVEANFNATPPASDVHLSHVYLLTKGRAMALILVKDADCVVFGGAIDQENLEKLEAPPGDPS